VAWQYGQMHLTLFFPILDVTLKYLFYDHAPGGRAVCANVSKLVLNDPNVKKYFFWNQVSGGLALCANASELDFNTQMFIFTFFWNIYLITHIFS
jgi:hypothetical protein